MHKWTFSGNHYGKNFVCVVKANDKQTAIKKGMDKFKAKFGMQTEYWTCNLNLV